MANVTATQLLAAVNEAILNLVTAKATFVSVDGRQYTTHDLEKLRKMRAELKKEAAEEAAASGSIGAGGRPLASGFSVNPADF